MNPKNQTYMSICIAVIHYIATAERRVHALRELSRVLRVSAHLLLGEDWITSAQDAPYNFI